MAISTVTRLDTAQLSGVSKNVLHPSAQNAADPFYATKRYLSNLLSEPSCNLQQQHSKFFRVLRERSLIRVTRVPLDVLGRLRVGGFYKMNCSVDATRWRRVCYVRTAGAEVAATVVCRQVSVTASGDRLLF
jgi:hypothetical protein